ncbi:MAG: thiolase family protein [Promethearchaeota archaeon]
MNEVALIGFSAIPVGKYPEVLETELAVEVISKALENTGIVKEQIEGLYTTNNYLNIFHLQMSLVAEAMQISPKSMAEIDCGGAAGGLALKLAMSEIKLGYVDIAICYAAEREATINSQIHRMSAEEQMGNPCYDPSQQPIRNPFGTQGVICDYAFSARRYMHEYGATEEDFAQAVVRDNKNAMHSPYAAFKLLVTVDDVLNSKPICSPIKLYDSCSIRDGAVAIILTRADLARKYTDTPIFFKGFGQFHDSNLFTPSRIDQPLSSFIAVREAAKRAFSMCKIKPDEVNVAELYAPFSPQELMIPEDIGWFPKGGMVQGIKDGSTEIGGIIPINTDGGLLARGHPAFVTPLYEAVTIFRQLQGEAGKTQVDNAKIGLMQCEGGLINNCFIAIFERGN